MITFLKGCFVYVGVAALWWLPQSAHAMDLHEALALTYTNNPELQAERERAKEIDEEMYQAFSGWLPNFSASYSLARENFDAGAEEVRRPHNRQFSVSQPIFSGGETVARVKRAKARVEAAHFDLLQQEQLIFSDAVVAYMDVVHTARVLELSKHNEKVLEEQLDATKARFELGETTRTDVAQAESRLATALSDRIRAEGDVIAARAEFERVALTSAPEGASFPNTLPAIPESLNEALEIAEQNNPALRSTDLLIVQAEAEENIAIAGILPDVSLNGSVTRRGSANFVGGGSVESELISLDVTIPIYQAGVEYSRVRAAKRNVAESKMQLHSTRNNVTERVITSWKDIETSRATIKATQAAVAAAKIALDGVRQEHEVGARTVLDILDAEQELFSAQVNLSGAKRNEVVAVYNLLGIMGHLTASHLDLNVDIYDPLDNYKDVRFQIFGF